MVNRRTGCGLSMCVRLWSVSAQVGAAPGLDTEASRQPCLNPPTGWAWTTDAGLWDAPTLGTTQQDVRRAGLHCPDVDARQVSAHMLHRPPARLLLRAAPAEPERLEPPALTGNGPTCRGRLCPLGPGGLQHTQPRQATVGGRGCARRVSALPQGLLCGDSSRGSGRSARAGRWGQRQRGPRARGAEWSLCCAVGLTEGGGL